MQTILRVIDDVISNEALLNEMDAKVGDGDCGSTAKVGCLAVKTRIQESGQISIHEIGDALSDNMGGSSGPLLSSFFYGLGAQFSREGLQEGLRRLKELG